jgi:hypothetical protein
MLAEPEGGALARAGLGSQLEQALGALPAAEKYNAVLEGLISRPGEGTEAALFDLVAEMTAKRIKLNGKSIKALVDYGVEAKSAQLLLRALGSARVNGAVRAFASPQARLSARPGAGALSSLPKVPTDDRATEIGAAAAFSLVMGGLLLTELADLVDFLLPFDLGAPPAQIGLVGIAASWAGDRYTQQGKYFGVVSGRPVAWLASPHTDTE